jgi:hypothetical protein
MEITITGISNVNSVLNKTLNNLVKEIVEDVNTTIVSLTPVKSGNARRGWKKTANSVENDVPYIGRLEAGSSRQAPRGMIMPTLTQIKGKYK